MINMKYWIFIFILSNLVTLSLSSQKTEKEVNEKHITGNYEMLSHNNFEREYFVYSPKNYDETIKVPLMLHFHGGAGDIASAIGYSDMGSISDANGFILVYPQALPEPGSNKSGGVWTYKDSSVARDVDNIGFVERIISTLISNYNVDEDRVYASGFSNGGEFVFELACRMSDKIAAVGVVARSMEIGVFTTCKPTYPVGVLSIHGTKDDYNGITFGGKIYYPSINDVNQFWVSHNDLNTIPKVIQLPDLAEYDGSTVEHYIWNNDDYIAVEHYKIINGGHDWPGSWGNMDIDASSIIWNFVKRFSRSELKTEINIARDSDGISVSTDTKEGQSYRIQASQDLKQWSNQEVIQGDGSTKAVHRSSDQPKEFFRLVEE